MVRNTWIISPVIDTLFICGGLPWILGITTEIILRQHVEVSATPLTVGFIVMSLLVGESHQFSSILRLFKKRIIDTSPGTIRAAVLIVLSLSLLSLIQNASQELPTGPLVGIPRVLWDLAAFIFPFVLMHHICAQAKAIGLIYCAKHCYSLSAHEQQLLSIAFNVFIVCGSLSIANPFHLDFTPLEIIKLPIFGAAIVSVCAISLEFSRRGKEKNEWLPLGTALTWANLALWILLPFNYIWLFVPVFFHASQHWALSWSTYKNEHPFENDRKEFMPWLKRTLSLILPIQVLTAIVLFLPILIGGNETLSVAWSMGVFYIHYLADRVVWRKPKATELHVA